MVVKTGPALGSGLNTSERGGGRGAVLTFLSEPSVSSVRRGNG